MLRDRLVCGVNDERIQRRLLAESQLEFKKTMELATAMETADKNTVTWSAEWKSERTWEPPKNRQSTAWPKTHQKIRNCHQGIRSNQMQQENVFVLEASFTMQISAGKRTKSALNATRRATAKWTNVAAIVNQVVEMAKNLETHITWRQQKRSRKNTQCFTWPARINNHIESSYY